MVKDEYILGIGGILGHDANVALFKGKELIASSQEERFTRIKHDSNFPINSIEDCLKTDNISKSEISVIVFSEKPLQNHLFNVSNKPNNRLSQLLGKSLPSNTFSGTPYLESAREHFPKAKIKYAWHHLAHAAGGYHSSKFTSTAFLCVDGKGEDINASIGIANEREIKILYEMPFQNGLGMLYTVITHFLGFPAFGSEYKVMGLGPYGNPIYTENLKRLFTSSEAGEVQLKRQIGFHPNEINTHLNWIEETLQINRRKDGEDLGEEHVDLAASLQVIFEEEILKMALFAKEKTGEENLLFCGGCAQNCVSAGRLRDSGIFKEVFNSPIGGDMGSGLGAALLYLRSINKLKADKLADKGFYLGSQPGELKLISSQSHRVNYSGSLHRFVAELLAKGKIVGWVRNGMELGARALGARSILANPLDPEMQTKMNLKIKFRESFRPFAPAILEEEQNNWFDCEYPSHYMQYTAFLKPELRYSVPNNLKSFKDRLNYPRCKVPSIVHVDFSARLQTVSKNVHPDFYELISKFNEITGIPILINTSFNVNGQPIVRTAHEAWECFENTEIDFLVINDDVYSNPFIKTKTEKLQWLEQFASYSK
jgi:carbamoyltransferase